MSNNYQKELEQILQKIEERKDVRAFCVKCGQMSLLEYRSIHDSYFEEWYKCNQCSWGQTGTEYLKAYNKKRFEQ